MDIENTTQRNGFLRKNPSRKTCESIIRRILMTEVSQQGENRHFKHAVDFMSYFESLYPTSDSLTKQVQRAVKSMNMPKDENGYFIVNKSMEQMEQDSALKTIFSQAHVKAMSLENYTPIFLEADTELCPYLRKLLTESVSFQDLFITIAETSNGLILYTKQPEELEKMLQTFCDPLIC
ncbi:MAG: hypothetical protein NC307_04680 [Roseburia sp.]|nr:hypothetical protein [Roseburia sp.]